MSGLKGTLSGVSLLLALSVFLSCGASNSPTSTATSYVGYWLGTEALPSGPAEVNFTVLPTGRVFCFGFANPNDLNGTLNTGCGDSTESVPIVGNSFSFSAAAVAGQFSSSTQASGTLVVINGTPTTYAWTASLRVASH